MEPPQPPRTNRSVPSFLKRTYEMLQDSSNEHIVTWTPSGVGFLILDQTEFSRLVLPKYFKHNKYSSFVRQLNMYNFHKIRSHGTENCFVHEHFLRSNKKSIEWIRRKPEKKKQKGGSDSLSEGKENSNDGENYVSPKPKLRRPPTTNKPQSLLSPHSALNNLHVTFSPSSDKCLKNPSSSSNSNTAAQHPPPFSYLQAFQDNISIEDDLERGSKQDLRVPTRLLLHNDGSGVFPIHTGMISEYSLSSFFK